MKHSELVIIGSGMAGYGLLRALRRSGVGIAVTLISRDDGAAYLRSDLAPGLAGRRDARDLRLATAAQMAYRLEAEILTLQPVREIDPTLKRVRLDGSEIAYERLVLATGGEPRRPVWLKGSATDQILTISSLAEYSYFNTVIAGRLRVAVLGGNLAGCELAGNLRAAGLQVTLFEPAGQLLQGLLPTLCAHFAERALTTSGVRILCEEGLQRVDQGADALELLTLAGARCATDVVVAALGSTPRTALADAAGLEIARGIRVDERLATSDPSIFALGECAEFEGRTIDLPEDIDQAAKVLASVLAGQPGRMVWRPTLRRARLAGCPLLICEPPNVAGEWHERATRLGLTAEFHDRAGELRGFALMGSASGDSERLLRRMAR